eukprot:382304-Amphidinium_carterae.1
MGNVRFEDKSFTLGAVFSFQAKRHETEEARAEAIGLMGVKHGLVTPKNGEVAVSATQDFLTASFLMTQKDVFLSRDKFCQAALKPHITYKSRIYRGILPPPVPNPK